MLLYEFCNTTAMAKLTSLLFHVGRTPCGAPLESAGKVGGLLGLQKLGFAAPRRQAARFYRRGIVKSAQEDSKVELRKLRTTELHFKRRLRAIYKRFSDYPDTTVIHGRHHVYFEEGGNIYRMSLINDARGAEPVLCVDGLVQRLGSSGWTVQRVRLSPGETLLAAAVKSPDIEEAVCVIVRLGVTPQLLHTEPKVFSFEWATDGILFYTSQENLQCRQVYRLVLSAEGIQRTLVYEEKDPAFFVEVSSSMDRQLLTINCSSKRSSEVRVTHCRSPLLSPVLVQPRLPGLLYYAEHAGSQLYLLANTAPDNEYQLLRAPLTAPRMENWHVVHRPARGAGLIDLMMLENCSVMAMRACQQLCLNIIPLPDPTHITTVRLPPWACAFEHGASRVTDNQTFQFVLSSPVHPPARFLYSLAKCQLYSEDENLIPHHSAYSTTRVEATSKDGTLVPMTVFHRHAKDRLGSAPLLVHVYGAYGVDINMAFKPEKRMLLDQGWTLAYCHVRGGGELGLSWHRAGCLERKHRGVEDLEACIKKLFDQGISQPALTGITAHSAGAILVGALCNEQPQLLRAVTLQAPFLDVLGTMQDASLPLTVEEREEWGDPLADPCHWDSIASYCPCHNITPQRYPSMLITAYERDQRVPLAGVLRYVERLRAAVQTHSGHNKTEAESLPSVVLDVQPGSDHFGPEDLDKSLNEIARQYAFLYRELGIDWQY
ncbi:prolyl endopeptidase-like [Lepisosteus oculatus]|uniref:prolyl endopeptidase-like n=1 Tax=Lepisosteus oculatus TaxID=7918 RepID=UPI0035F50DCB